MTNQNYNLKKTKVRIKELNTDASNCKGKRKQLLFAYSEQRNRKGDQSCKLKKVDFELNEKD